MGVGEDFVDHAMTGDGSKGGGAVSAEDDEIGLLSAALVEQFLGGVAGINNGLDGDLIAQFGWNKAEEVGLDLFDGAAEKDFSSILGSDDMLQDQSRVVLSCEFGGERCDHKAAFDQADGRENGAGSEVAKSAVDDVGANDKGGDVGTAQNGLGDGADKDLADGTGRVGAHDDAVDMMLANIFEDLIGGEAGAHHHFAFDAGLSCALEEGLEMLDLRASRGGIVVVADTGSFRGSHNQRVVDVKHHQLGCEFPGLGESEVEGALVGGDFRGEQDGGGFAPTWLDGHGEPPSGA